MQAMTDPAPTTPTPGWYTDPEVPGAQRYWDGSAWTEHRAATVIQNAARNPAATAALVLGILGFLLMGIPLFIGLFIGGTLDVLAIIFGIVGLVRAGKVQRGFAAALVGLILGGVSIIAAFFGAGTVW